MSATQKEFLIDQDEADASGVLSVRGIAKALWVTRFTVATLIIIFAVVGIGLAVSKKAPYVASITIGPSEAETSGGGNTSLRLLGSVGGFGGQQGSFDKYIQLLRSVRVARAMNANGELASLLFPQAWDDVNKRWLPPRGPLGKIKEFIFGAAPTPTTEELSDSLNARLSINPASSSNGGIGLSLLKNQIYVVSVSGSTPEQALGLLSGVVEDADKLAREDHTTDLENRLKYLTQGVSETADVTLRESLMPIIVEQQRKLMMLKTDRLYSYDEIDAPHVLVNRGNNALGPNVFLAVLIGFLLSAFLLFLRLQNAVANGEDVDLVLARLATPANFVKGLFKQSDE